MLPHRPGDRRGGPGGEHTSVGRFSIRRLDPITNPTIGTEPRRRLQTMKRFMLLTIAAVALFVAVGCAKPPQEDISAAQAEMDKARQAQAENWAPTEYRAADEAMNAAQAEIKAQDEKWMKNDDKAQKLLAKA